jgi:general secretion pathway protein E
VLGFPALAQAAPVFPRGPGLYLNLLSLGLIVALYVGWLALCGWIDQDARRLDLDRTRWNGLAASGGLAGLLLFWIVPWFAISLPLLLAFLVAPAAAYIRRRNALVPEAQRVATDVHLRKLANSYLHLELPVPAETPSGPEVHFRHRPGEETGRERPRTRRSQTLPCYPPALALMCDAVQRRATELHLEPLDERVNVRLQIDGVFHDAETLSRSRADGIVQVIKTWADLNSQVRDRLQEGTFVAEIDGDRVDFRARVEPIGPYEHLKLTIEDHTQRILRFDQLGMTERVREAARSTLGLASGLFIVCGPEDSGRTTTAYACLHELDRMRRNILTLEDPIHQRVSRFEQMHVKRAAGENFATALRRLTPGVGPRIVLIGEIVDGETADLAVQKAEEGRLVISTLRAHDAVAGLYRFIELGVAPERLAVVIHGVLNQRLIRLLCDYCKVRYRPDPEAIRRANLSIETVKLLCRIPEEAEMQRDERGAIRVCPACRGIGYHGRTGVFEFFPVTERARDLLRSAAPVASLKQEAVKSGMNYLQDEALNLACRGLTSIPEMIQALKE